MTFVCKYIALHVTDLRAAETFYREVFALELLFRECEGSDGVWRTLRPELDWDDARARGFEVDMVALGREAFVLALFPGIPARGTVYEICVGVTAEEVDDIRTRARQTATVLESHAGWMRFLDPFGFRWAVQSTDARFRSSGEIAGRWIG